MKLFCRALLFFCAAFSAACPLGWAKQMDISSIPEWQVKSADVGGTLLFSDSPEEVGRDGILYADTVEGKVRLLYYHLNATKEPKKIVAVLENQTNQDSQVLITNHAMGGPSKDYLHVGKTTQEQYFGGKHAGFVQVAAYGKRLLHSRFSEIVVKPGELVYGVFDFELHVPMKVSVMMLPVGADPLTFVRNAKVLPADKSHLRGTFTGMDRILQAEPYDGSKHGPVAITLADSKIDRYRTGIDATDGSVVENYGNYGVQYYISVPTVGTEVVQYYLNPCGGVYAGAVTVQAGDYGQPERVSTPDGKPFFGDGRRVTDTQFLGRFLSGRVIKFEFSPPGASNLPARLLLLPDDDATRLLSSGKKVKIKRDVVR